jgi:hypothetical protein
MNRKRLLGEARELLAEARGGRTAGGDDPQLVDCLPFTTRLQLVEAQELALREAREVLEADLPPSTWAILAEWEQATPKLNRALRAARRKAGIPDTSPHLTRVADLPLPQEVKAMMNDWNERAGDAS